MDATSISLGPGTQVLWLFILALPVACVSWTVTHEEIFRELHDYLVRQSKESHSIFRRKLFYMFTCEYCFSHYVAIAFLAISEYQLYISGWRGYVLAWFAMVWIANIYMSLYGYLRVDLKKERLETKLEERKFVRMKDRPKVKEGRDQ
jgi:hypothetical protein